MKKLLTFLMTVGVVTPTITGVVACMPQAKFNPLTIGMGIDKSKAVNDSVEPDENKESDYTNYFIVGDSLSDVDGVNNYLIDKAQPILDNVIADMGYSDMISAKVSAYLDGDGYGFTNDSGFHSAFSNGVTAAYVLGEQLGFKDLKNSNHLITEPYIVNDKKTYGKNYSIGGATAAQTEGVMGALLSDVTIEKQATTLIQQHIISSNDVTAFEIGGNDLFAMIDNWKDEKVVNQIFDDGINAIRKGLFTLLNNGIKKIAFITPPKMNQVPRYVDLYKSQVEEDIAQTKFIDSLGERYEAAILAVLDEVNAYYKDQIETYDLYNQFSNLLNWFKGTGPNKVVDKGYTSSTEARVLVRKGSKFPLSSPITYTEGLYKDTTNYDAITLGEFMANLEELLSGIGKSSRMMNQRATFNFYIPIVMLAENKDSDPSKNIDNYFFTDFVHPTKAVHDYVGKMLAEELLK